MRAFARSAFVVMVRANSANWPRDPKLEKIAAEPLKGLRPIKPAPFASQGDSVHFGQGCQLGRQRIGVGALLRADD